MASFSLGTDQNTVMCESFHLKEELRQKGDLSKLLWKRSFKFERDNESMFHAFFYLLHGIAISNKF